MLFWSYDYDKTQFKKKLFFVLSGNKNFFLEIWNEMKSDFVQLMLHKWAKKLRIIFIKLLQIVEQKSGLNMTKSNHFFPQSSL